jgi:hypothetical protein
MLCGGLMQRISLPYVYEVAGSLKQLSNVQCDKPLKDSIYFLYTAENALQEFLYNSVYSSGALKATVLPGGALLQAIKKLTTAPDKERMLDFLDTWSVSNALTKFETVLAAEMNYTDVFLVTKKRGYDTTDLIERGEILLPIEFTGKIPEAVHDIRQAGKCLAFEIATAAGFHMMRALELVLRLYYDAVSGGGERPKTNNMGDYLRLLDENNWGDEKVRSVLRQIKDLHRNELIHPEVTLTLDEALALWGIVQSAIISMLPAIPEKEMKLTP